MAKEIIVAVGDVEVTAELLVDNAPRMCEMIERHLPIVGIYQHAKLVDREIFFQCPFFLDVEENLKLSEPGDISFWDARQVFCIFFDEMKPMPGLAATVARFTGDIKAFQEAVASSWEEPDAGRFITFMTKDAGFEGGRQRLIAARERIWHQEPSDIARLLSKEGARGQKATPRLYAATKLQTFQTFLNHMRTMAMRKGDELDLGTLTAITIPLFQYYQNYFAGHNYGMTETGKVIGWAADALQQVTQLEEFVTLLTELEMFIGRMDYWVDLHIPWAKLGQVVE